MKIAVMGDPHWSQNSSIMRARGQKYSRRLENLIESMNWFEQLAWDTNCATCVCVGDFFDSAVMNAEEISALKEVKWNALSHIYLTGNHESNVSSLDFATSDIFSLCNTSLVISKPTWYDIEDEDVEFCFLPYITERDRQPLETYFPAKPTTRRRILFSHNDLKDVQYGPFLSKEGFTVNEIEACCDLMINGHIHHCAYVTDKIINCGNLTGQNFTEDAYKYEHCALIIDTETLHVDFYINPCAFNFYKIDATMCNSESEVASKLAGLKDHSVITIKVNQSIACTTKTQLAAMDTNKIEAYRVIVEAELQALTEETQQFESIDHLKQFENYVLTNIGTSDIVRQELEAVMR